MTDLEVPAETIIVSRITCLQNALGLGKNTFLEILSLYGVQSEPISEELLRFIEIMFNVNPEWLRQGKGKMFDKVDKLTVKTRLATEAIRWWFPFSEEDIKAILKYIEEKRELAQLRKERGKNAETP
jgi:hypothetical protein